jgi:hypothetical protein
MITFLAYVTAVLAYVTAVSAYVTAVSAYVTAVLAYVLGIADAVALLLNCVLSTLSTIVKSILMSLLLYVCDCVVLMMIGQEGHPLHVLVCKQLMIKSTMSLMHR